MDVSAGQTTFHYVEHGSGRPVVALHGAGVDHRESEACFEPMFDDVTGFRRIYPDLPGMGETLAPASIRSADDVVDALLEFTDAVSEGENCLLVGHSAGAYFAQAMAERRHPSVVGLALVCPLLSNTHDVPSHRVVEGSGTIGDDDFRNYFVVHTPEMLSRYERYVMPGAALVDSDALARIGEHWALADVHPPTYKGPTLIVAGRLDSTVGFSAAEDLERYYQAASLAVVDDAGHALPHERPEVLRDLIHKWLTRIERRQGD